LKTLMMEAMDLARMRGAQYADIRVTHHRAESLSAKNGGVEAIDLSESLGFGVRVLARGAWGFACSRDLNSKEIKRVTGLALQVARASALARGDAIDLGPAVVSWDLAGHAPRIASEAAALLTADLCPSEITTTVILGGDQMALQIHESAGHPAELDRVFGSEAAYAGASFLTPDKLGRMLRNPTYTGATPDFWNSCDAVCNAEAWTMFGTPHCGKGQPGQVVHTGHGAAPARFRNVRVGVLK
jgi:predicted Zn-dependent protease